MRTSCTDLKCDLKQSESLEVFLKQFPTYICIRSSSKYIKQTWWKRKKASEIKAGRNNYFSLKPTTVLSPNFCPLKADVNCKECALKWAKINSVLLPGIYKRKLHARKVNWEHQSSHLVSDGIIKCLQFRIGLY